MIFIKLGQALLVYATLSSPGTVHSTERSTTHVGCSVEWTVPGDDKSALDWH